MNFNVAKPGCQVIWTITGGDGWWIGCVCGSLSDGCVSGSLSDGCVCGSLSDTAPLATDNFVDSISGGTSGGHIRAFPRSRLLYTLLQQLQSCTLGAGCQAMEDLLCLSMLQQVHQLHLLLCWQFEECIQYQACLASPSYECLIISVRIILLMINLTLILMISPISPLLTLCLLLLLTLTLTLTLIVTTTELIQTLRITLKPTLTLTLEIMQINPHMKGITYLILIHQIQFP